MDITTFIAQFLGYFLVLIGGVMLLRRKVVEGGMRNALKNRGTLFIVGILDLAVGILLIMAHPSWESLTDKAISTLSWFLLIQGVFYMVATQKQIKGIIKFIHVESVYYTVSLAYVVVGASLIFAM